MGWQGTKTKMSYEMARMLPDTDSTIIVYEKFLKEFGQDGSVIFVGIQDSLLFQLNRFNAWYDLTCQLRNLEGIEGVLSVTNIFYLKRNDSIKKFDFLSIAPEKPQTQAEVDSIKKQIDQLAFYDEFLFNDENKVSIMMITLDKDVLNTKNRIGLIYEIKDILDAYSETKNIKVHISGMPYIRTMTTKKIQDELILFVCFSVFVAALILYAFFRSKKTVLFIITIVLLSVIFMFGTMALLGYQITIYTAVLPPLLIIIGVENSIFLLNKYYSEFHSHQNKIKALSRMIRHIGLANLLTNATTAAGFAAFTITKNQTLVEFGILASINILAVYLFSLFLIPIIFSYLKSPKTSQYQYFEKGWIHNLLNKIIRVVSNRRNAVYVLTVIVLLIGGFGVAKLRTTGRMVDDISHKDRLYKDLVFFEKNFNGVMPFEIVIDTHKKKGILRTTTISKIQQLQDSLAEYTQFSKPLSIVEVLKFSKQAFYQGNKKYYTLPSHQELQFMLSYLPDIQEKSNIPIVNSFFDSEMQRTRVSVQMANVTTPEIDSIQKSLQPKIKHIFPSEEYDVTLTGSSLVFLEGTNYMVKNLLSSLLLALVIIAILMLITFSSFKMVLIALIPNLIPQLLTAALMGYAGISIKPSTILIFSIALGISVDNTIHFLSHYRLQLKYHNGNIKDSVIAALRETGYSMIYSAIVLFFGFGIFMLSSFGGIETIGYLVPFTLFIAMLSNLFLFPALLLSLDKWVTTKRFKETTVDVNIDDEDAIEAEKIISETIQK
jgi:hydrophobe/amphiphile efflux-3 (HAE3) family protein